MIASVVFLLLVATGAAMMAYGTVAKNRFGINTKPVFCPRCKTALPNLRQPGSLHQELWGGWTCPVCGAGVDKWGREIVPIAPRTIVIPEDQVRPVMTKRLIFKAPVVFCILMALDWTRLTGNGFPSSSAQASLQICGNLVWTIILTITAYFIIVRRVKRAPPAEKPHDAMHQSDRSK